MNEKPVTASELPELSARFRLIWLTGYVAVAVLFGCGWVFWKATTSETLFGIASGTVRPLAAVGFLVALAYSFWNWRCPRCRSHLLGMYGSTRCSRCGVNYSFFDGAERYGDCDAVDSWKRPKQEEDDVE
jgi:hypothetical protein